MDREAKSNKDSDLKHEQTANATATLQQSLSMSPSQLHFLQTTASQHSSHPWMLPPQYQMMVLPQSMQQSFLAGQNVLSLHDGHIIVAPSMDEANGGQMISGEEAEAMIRQQLQLQHQRGLDQAATGQVNYQGGVSQQNAMQQLGSNAAGIHVGMGGDASLGVHRYAGDTPTKRGDPPAQPKKPLTPYMMFSKSIWPQVKAANSHLSSVCEIGAVIGSLWRDLSAEDKQKYNDQFTRDKERYDTELHNYLKSTGLHASDLVKAKAKRKETTKPAMPMNRSTLNNPSIAQQLAHSAASGMAAGSRGGAVSQGSVAAAAKSSSAEQASSSHSWADHQQLSGQATQQQLLAQMGLSEQTVQQQLLAQMGLSGQAQQQLLAQMGMADQAAQQQLLAQIGMSEQAAQQQQLLAQMGLSGQAAQQQLLAQMGLSGQAVQQQLLAQMGLALGSGQTLCVNSDGTISIGSAAPDVSALTSDAQQNSLVTKPDDLSQEWSWEHSDSSVSKPMPNGPSGELYGGSKTAQDVDRESRLEAEVLQLRSALSEKTCDVVRLASELEVAYRTIELYRQQLMEGSAGVEDEQGPGEVHERGLGEVHERGPLEAHESGSGEDNELDRGEVHEEGRGEVHEEGLGEIHEQGPGEAHEKGPEEVHEGGPEEIHEHVSGEIHKRDPGEIHFQDSGEVHEQSLGEIHEQEPGEIHERDCGEVHGETHKRDSGEVHGLDCGEIHSCPDPVKELLPPDGFEQAGNDSTMTDRDNLDEEERRVQGHSIDLGEAQQEKNSSEQEMKVEVPGGDDVCVAERVQLCGEREDTYGRVGKEVEEGVVAMDCSSENKIALDFVSDSLEEQLVQSNLEPCIDEVKPVYDAVKNKSGGHNENNGEGLDV